MGLSGVKKRSKLSHDPNNTAWSRSTTNFGHKILSQQGWKPGDFLGAENANHSEHYTAANASHIRIMLREDNLGLGAQLGKGNADTFGLSMFSGLLGRLNGKSDGDVQKQQNAIRDVELRTYTGQKYGFMNFVSGGLLVGDKMQPKGAEIVAVKEQAGSDKSSKKRKADDEDGKTDKSEKKRRRKSEGKPAITETANETDESARKKEKKSKRDAQEASAQADSSASASESDSKAEEKRKRKERRKAERGAKTYKATSEDDEKARLKEEKRARKEERRRRKEEKRSKKAAKEDPETQESTHPSALPSESEGTATPPIQAFGGRQAVRRRYIQQKRMASMDPQALKEIFMLQAKAAAA